MRWSGIIAPGRDKAPIKMSVAEFPPRIAQPPADLARPADRPIRFVLTIEQAAYLALFVLARPVVGAQAANLTALLLTAIANTAANRRLTFGIRGAAGAGRAQALGLVVFGLGLALTSGSLLLLHALAPGASRLAEVLLLLAANAVATLVRFVLLRGWVFRARHAPLVRPAGPVLPGTVVPELESSR